VAHHSFRFGPYRASAPEEPEVSVDDLAAEQEGEEGRPVPEPTPPLAPDRTPWGGSRPRPPLRMWLRLRLMRLLGHSFLPKISHPVDHGDVLELAGREWFVLHTPGHTPDHFCLHDPDTGILLAGDHVLPSITPHISGISRNPDPLRSFFYSLDRVGEIQGVKQVLPAHGHPFADLRARTEAIKRHHRERLEKVKAICRELGPATVQQISQRLFQPRSWGPMAESETYAHLEHLLHLDQAERRRERDGRLIYEAG
jgi:glyoxylase-like metal-dependent hydrolase (beta-lactamase superfamily II)